jgi:SAM-dependent methyltransferase
MAQATSPQPSYSLGTDPSEIARLDGQARFLAAPTDLLLRAAGIGPGMRVLDLGTGLGHVAFAVAGLVGPSGTVLGIDQAAPLLDIAEKRRQAAGVAHVRFAEADVLTFAEPRPFDAVVGRLILFHLPDPVAAVRHHASALAPGGRFVALDFDIGSVRAEPPVPLLASAAHWIVGAFAHAGAHPLIGARLGPILRDAGLTDVTTFGIQPYLPPGDPVGPALVAGVVRSLAPVILAAGLADKHELDLETLEQRIATDLREADAVLLTPDLVGAWGIPPTGGA